MKRLSLLTLTMILVWIVAKMGLLFFGNAIEGFGIMVMLNMLFILVAEFFALWFKYKTVKRNESTFLNDLSSCIKSAAIYILAIVGFSLLYYSVIDPGFNEFQIGEAVRVATEQTSNPEYWEELKRRDGSMPDDITPERYIEKARETATSFSNWRFRTGMSLFVLVFIAIINSLFVTLLFRKVLLK